ncbi:hypothetical protein D1BOALGB6SA_4874 [Olavius sp. associated proteobacterium Delta 1]|nr:hypothetical protein D1BOALGB6SA_4874 [Olavius sp. associated proteobacterium Delta 1]
MFIMISLKEPLEIGPQNRSLEGQISFRREDLFLRSLELHLLKFFNVLSSNLLKLNENILDT